MMTRLNDWDENVVVPEFLCTGAHFQLCQDTFTSGIQPVQRCLIKVDEYGFFLHWRSQDQEAQLLDCTQIREACNKGYQIKDQKAYGILDSLSKNVSSQDRIIILVCGCDMVNYSTFLLLAEDASAAQKWISGLRYIIFNRFYHNISFNLALRKHWMKLCLMANKDGKMTVKSITRPFSSGKNAKLALQILRDMDLANTKNDMVDRSNFTFEHFFRFYQKVCVRSDIEKVFSSITNGARCAFVESGTLTQWLNDHQRDPRLNEILFPMYNDKSSKVLIRKYEPDPEMAKKGRLSLEGFASYISSLENSAVYRKQLTVFEDMDQPLCHYSINSSHNTYLNGRQFMGDSSVEMYRQVLLSGCRCIELDCWDGKGENQGQPIITHGKAMCTDVLFINVLHAINDTAFATSDYPVILSFENHCSKPLQLKLAKYCEEVFGSKLLKKPLDGYPLEKGRTLPSPSMLKGKIIIKNKRLMSDVERMQLERYYRHSEIMEEEDEIEVPEDDSSSVEEAHPELARICKSDPMSSISEEVGTVENDVIQDPVDDTSQIENTEAIEIQVQTIASKDDIRKSNSGSIKKENKGLKKTDSAGEFTQTWKSGKSRFKKGNLSEEEEKELLKNYKYIETSSTNIHPLLSSFINYCQSVKFQSFRHAEEQKLYYQMSSFSESMGFGLLKASAMEFVNYNKRQLSRIYPKGNRVDSSNYTPQVFWNAGCQMVSLNFQTSDLSTQLNQGRFEFNGNCGYLLKPEFMRREDRTFDPFSITPVDGVIAAHCSIEVISGIFLSDKQIGTYVEVDMYGLSTDTIRKEFKTKLVPGNGLNPIYNSQPFVFRKVILPTLALIRLAVHDENGKLLGQRVIPLEALQCGYRYISLRSASGHPLDPASLFCNISLKSYVPDGMSDFVNALADPKKYTSLSEKRAVLMRNMGIDDDILDENGAASDSTDSGSAKLKQRCESEVSRNTTTSSGIRNVASEPAIRTSSVQAPKEVERVTSHRQYLPSTGRLAQQSSMKDLMSKNAVTIEMLTADPEYQKLVVVQSKEIDRIRAKLDKERQVVERKHKDKLFNLLTRLEDDTPIRVHAYCCIAPKLRSNVTDDDFESRLNKLPPEEREKVLVVQKRQTELVESSKTAYQETLTRLREHQCDCRHEMLKKLLEDSHKKSLEEFKAAQEKAMAELTNHQTRSSVLGSREIGSDKSIKKAEKDRRIREMKSSNVKKFMAERQLMSSKHNQQLDMIEKDQQIQEQLLTVVIKEYIENQRKKLSDNNANSTDGNTANHDTSEDAPSESVFFELESKSELTADK